MEDGFAHGNFLGLPDPGGPADVVIASIPYELTTSYGTGTAGGPQACIEASGQVELYDEVLGEELPSGKVIRTLEPWDGEGNSLSEQLQGISNYVSDCFSKGFPVFLGGEHGILPAIVRGAPQPMTIIQIDAHADLRSELNGEPYSHACAAARALDEGATALYQVGIRAYCKEELDRIESDERIQTWFARDVLEPCGGQGNWEQWLNALTGVEGPVHLSIDIDGLDGQLVPATGTPVPGGLSFWHVAQTIETLFENCEVVSADVNEIVEQKGSPLTQFTAAMLVKIIVGCHINNLR